jgi:dCTP diphosphatase
MLSKCDRVIVLKLPGWENSKGVAAEIARAEELGLPIEWMEMDEVKYQNALAIASSFHKDLLDRLQVFDSEREWEQFHSPKNLAMNLGVEAGELMEHFRWMTEPQSYVKCSQKLAEIRDELGDVYLVLLQLAHNLGIELHQAAHDKLSKIAKKYPVEYCKGLSHKYTEYESESHKPINRP